MGVMRDIKSILGKLRSFGLTLDQYDERFGEVEKQLRRMKVAQDDLSRRVSELEEERDGDWYDIDSKQVS